MPGELITMLSFPPCWECGVCCWDLPLFELVLCTNSCPAPYKALLDPVRPPFFFSSRKIRALSIYSFRF